MIPNRKEVEAELTTMSPKELSEFLLIGGKLLMKTRTLHEAASPFIALKAEDDGEQELIIYCRGTLAEKVSSVFQEYVSRFGGSEQRI